VIRIPYGESPGVWCRKDPDKFLDWQVVNLDLHGNQVETLTEEDKINLHNAIFRHLKMPPAELNSEPSFYGNLPWPPFEDPWRRIAWSQLFRHVKWEKARLAWQRLGWVAAHPRPRRPSGSATAVGASGPSAAPEPLAAPNPSAASNPSAAPMELNRDHPALKGIEKGLIDGVLSLIVKPEGVKFDQIHGVENAKEQAKDGIDAMQNPDEGNAPGGMLLSGPPGTGKSMLADAISNEVGSCPVFEVKADWFKGNELRKITALFAVAQAMAPSILFFNECDAIMHKGTGTGGPPKYVAHLKDTWEEGDGGGAPVLVMGNSNHPPTIEPALRSRFTIKVEFTPPNPNARKQIICDGFAKKGLRHDISEAEWQAIINATDGWVGRDLALGLVKQIAATHQRKYRGTEVKPAITAHDVAAKLPESSAELVRSAAKAPEVTRAAETEAGPSEVVAGDAGPSETGGGVQAEASSSEEDMPLKSRGGKQPATSGSTGSSRKRKERESSSDVAAPKASKEVNAIVHAIDAFYEVDATVSIPRKELFEVIRGDNTYVKTFKEADLNATIHSYNAKMNTLLEQALAVIATRNEKVTVKADKDTYGVRRIYGLRRRAV